MIETIVGKQKQDGLATILQRNLWKTGLDELVDEVLEEFLAAGR